MQLTLKNVKVALRCSMKAELNMEKYVALMNGLAVSFNAMIRHARLGG